MSRASVEDVTLRELRSGSHPVKEVLTAAAHGAEVLTSDLDHAASTARPGQREQVRKLLTDTVREVGELYRQGAHQEARRTAQKVAYGLADRVSPGSPRHGIFSDPDREASPAVLAARISRR